MWSRALGYPCRRGLATCRSPRKSIASTRKPAFSSSSACFFQLSLSCRPPCSQNDGPLAGPVKVGVDQPAVRGRIRDMLLGADSA